MLFVVANTGSSSCGHLGVRANDPLLYLEESPSLLPVEISLVKKGPLALWSPEWSARGRDGLHFEGTLNIIADTQLHSPEQKGISQAKGRLCVAFTRGYTGCYTRCHARRTRLTMLPPSVTGYCYAPR